MSHVQVRVLGVAKPLYYGVDLNPQVPADIMVSGYTAWAGSLLRPGSRQTNALLLDQ